MSGQRVGTSVSAADEQESNLVYVYCDHCHQFRMVMVIQVDGYSAETFEARETIQCSCGLLQVLESQLLRPKGDERRIDGQMQPIYQ